MYIEMKKKWIAIVMCTSIISCQDSVPNVTPGNFIKVLEGYTCPLVMSNYFVVLNKDGKNVIKSSAASTLIVLPDKPGVYLDPPRPRFLGKVRLVSDTTKAPSFGGFAALTSLAPGAQTFDVVVDGVNYGTVSYKLISLGNYDTGNGCFVMNSITFNGKAVGYDKTVGIIAHFGDIKGYEFYSGSSAPVLIFQM